MHMEPLQPSRPPVNAIMRSALLRAAEVVEALTENGMTVVGAEFTTPARPTIRIQTCGKCQALIDNGQAAYYSFGRDSLMGPYQVGQFTLGECRVIWMEFGH